MYNPFSLINKVILITGASSGIGRAVAIECAKMGAMLILTARNEERLKETLSQLEGNGHKYISADLTVSEERIALCHQIESLDGVVFCAGKSMFKPIQVLNESDIETIFFTNYTAPVLLTQSLIKAHKLNRQSSLVYIASISGNGNIATALSLYGSSKSSLSTFVQYAALEFSRKGIRCNTICPGRINTGFIQNQTMSAEEVQKDLEKYPLCRYGEAKEVAWAAVYLLSDATTWMTGTALKLDGGRTLV